MIEKHKSLLEAIEMAEVEAKGIYREGGKIENALRKLREARAVVEGRLKHYREQAKEGKPPVKSVKGGASERANGVHN